MWRVLDQVYRSLYVYICIVKALALVTMETVYCSGNCFSLFGASEVRGSTGTRRAELNPKTLCGSRRGGGGEDDEMGG